VRGCGRGLTGKERSLVCEQGHAYDVARSGYVNLLQPQDRRSLDTGDSTEVAAARRRLFDAGIGLGVVDAIAARMADLVRPADACIVDLGCGTGDALARIAARTPAIGIDISTRAVEHAARRYPAMTWVVANADRRLPLPDASVSLVISLHARRNPDECARVLASGGHLIAAVPAADDLVELRAAVHGTAIERDRVHGLIDEHASLFDVVEQAGVSERRDLAREALKDLLQVTYRGARRSQASAAGAVSGMSVTFASDVVVFARRG
jgi:23S rRNA (guanine745-N1)-methyltransferase